MFFKSLRGEIKRAHTRIELVESAQRKLANDIVHLEDELRRHLADANSHKHQIDANNAAQIERQVASLQRQLQAIREAIPAPTIQTAGTGCTVNLRGSY